MINDLVYIIGFYRRVHLRRRCGCALVLLDGWRTLQMSDDPDAQYQLVIKATQALSEHFEVVQIFTSSVVPGSDKTRHFSAGQGNWFARYGQVKNWIVVEEERSRIDIREAE